MAVNRIYIDEILGNDANPGTVGSPVATFVQAHTLASATAGDENYLILKSAIVNFPSANTSYSKAITVESFDPLNPSMLRSPSANAQTFSNASGVKFRSLILDNNATTMSSSRLTFSSATATSVLEDVGFSMSNSTPSAAYITVSNNGMIILNRCHHVGSTKLRSWVNGGRQVFLNNYVTKTSNKVSDTALSIVASGNRFGKEVAGCFMMPSQIDGLNIYYNVFDLENGNGSGVHGDIISTGTQTHNEARFYNNAIINTRQINNSGVALGGYLCRTNFIATGVGTTNYTGNSDLTGSAASAQFIDPSTGDYEFLLTSPLWGAGFDGGSIGFTEATKLRVIDSTTDLAPAKVQNAEAYKYLDDNRTGTLVGGSGTYPTASNVKTGSGLYGPSGTEYTPSYSPDFPDRVNVAPDDTVDGLSGTMDLPALNKVAPTDTLRGATGTMDLPSLSSVDPLDTLEGANGTMDVPALNKVAPTDTLRGANGTLDLPALSSVDPADTLEGVNGTLDLPALNKVAPTDTLKGQAGTLDLPSLSNVDPSDTLEGTPGTLDVNAKANIPLEADVKTGSGSYGRDLDKVPSYSPDFPARSNVTPDDTVNGEAGLLDLPALNKVAPSDTLRGVPGTMDLPALSNVYNDTLEGQAGTFNPDFPHKDSVLTTDTTNGEAGTVTLPVISDVKKDVLYGANNSLEGTLEVSENSVDPTPGKVIKGTEYVINGVPKVGEYDIGSGHDTSTNNQRYDILKEIENILYAIRPSTDSLAYQQVIKSVFIGAGSSPQLNESDMPSAQVSSDETGYDHRKLAFGGAHPVATLRVRLLVTASASYEPIDMEQLLEDVEQAFMKQNFNLNGKAMSVELTGSRQLPREAGSESEVRQFELALLVTYIRKI